MDLVLCIKCWVFPFMLKIPHLLLITVILVSLVLDEYLRITFLPWLLIKCRHSGPNPARFPTCLTRWLNTLQNQPAQVRLFTALCPSLATTHTTSSPRLLFPPLCRQSGTCQVLSVICPTAWVAKGLRWTSLKLVVKRHIYSFIFPNSFYFLYLFLWCPWLDQLPFFF